MSWKIDPTHTHVGFSVKHMMVSTVRGQFKAYTGTLELDLEDLTRSVVAGEIEVASIDTANTDRDNHLRSADFFDVENHPVMAFKSTRIEREGDDEYKVYGELTLRGVTREIVLDAEYAGLSKDPWGGTRTGISLRGSLNRKDFGLTWNAALETGGILVGEKIKLELDIQAVLQEASVAV